MKESDSQPLVTVGVPVYNGANYLEECLQSILDQSYSNWECVIINNHSDDRSPEIAEAFVNKDPRFKLYHTTELLPITRNWNYCFSRAREDSVYFKLLPADDWIDREFLAKLVEVMENDPDTGIATSYRLVDKRVKSDGLDIYQGSGFHGKEMLKRQLLEEFNLTSSVNAVLYRMDALRKLEYFPEIFQDESHHQDTFLSYELLCRFKLGFVFQVLSYTRRHDDSVTSRVTDKLNTRLFFKEYALFHYLSLDSSLEKQYRRIRTKYAYFLLKSRLLSRKEVLKWHFDRMKRPIRPGEYIRAVFRRLFFRKL